MGKRLLFLLLIIIPAILSTGTEYKQFIDPMTVVCDGNTPNCIKSIVPQWTAYQYASKASSTFYLLLGSKFVTDPIDSYFFVPFSSAGQVGTCIQTTIKIQYPGDYKWTFKGFGESNQKLLYEAILTDSSNSETTVISDVKQVNNLVIAVQQKFKLDKTGDLKLRLCDIDFISPLITWLIGDIRFSGEYVPFVPVNNLINCKSSVLIGTQYVCYACNQSYVFESFNKCVPFVQFCYNYKNSLCEKCISNFSLVGQKCIKLPQKCQALDSTGNCSQCQGNFIVQGGKCVEKPKIITECLQSEYKDINGLCVKGTVSNCVKYSSPDGKCTECEANYNLNEKNECIKFCSEKNEKIMQMVINNVCVEVDANCIYWNDDGSCPICKNEFYSEKGKCKRIMD